MCPDAPRRPAAPRQRDALHLHQFLVRRALDAEPLVAPVKDASREALQATRTAGKVESEATNAPERVAALSQLEASNQRVAKRTEEMAHQFINVLDG